MAVIDGRTWLEHLTIEECWDKLARESVGRIGVLVDSAPEIYPINFLVDGRSIVFRTDPGGKLRGLDQSPAVCFEVDHLDPQDQTGWSVVVKGRAKELTASEDRNAVEHLPLKFWPLGEKTHWVRIRAIEVTGRRIHRHR